MPIDTRMESKLGADLVSKLAFAVQKLAEMKSIAGGRAAAGKGVTAEAKVMQIDKKLFSRSEPYAQRRPKQFAANPKVCGLMLLVIACTALETRDVCSPAIGSVTCKCRPLAQL